MDKEQVYLQSAFVLHQRPYQNTSAIVDIFSREYGRQSLIAKGVKRKKSPLKSILQSFQPLSLSWVRRSDLGVLVSAELQPPIIQLNNENLYSGLYLNELILRLLLPFDASPALFDTYSDTLLSLSNNRPVTAALRLFEKQLLTSLGYEIPLTQEAESLKAIEPDKYYSYLPEHGFIENTAEDKSDVHFKGEYLLAFANNQLDQTETLKTAHRLMHINLKRLLGSKPLKSRELYKAYLKI